MKEIKSFFRYNPEFKIPAFIFISVILLIGILIGEKTGYNRGIKMMNLADCDEELAKDIDNQLSSNSVSAGGAGDF